MSQFSLGILLGVLTGFGVSVVANFVYRAIAKPIGDHLVRNRIHFSPSGERYKVLESTVETCASVFVSTSRWGWLIREGEVPLSVRLTFKSRLGQEIKMLANWKMNMDEETISYVRLGSKREFILVTIQGNSAYPGSDITGTRLVGDWDVNVEIINGDTLQLYGHSLVKSIVSKGELSIP